MDLFQLLFGFSGRINRAKYWLTAVIYIVVMIVVVGVAIILSFAALGVLIVFILYIPLLISCVAVGIKRLHDRDKSGWWLLLFYLLPGILSGAGNAAGAEHSIFDLAGLAISLWGLVELGFLRGTAGANKFGPDPLAG